MAVLDDKEALQRQQTQSSQATEAGPSAQVAAALAQENLAIPPLEADQDAPPAYGDSHNAVQFKQPGFAAGANITDDGRVNINISTQGNRLADLLLPAIRQQMSHQGEPPLPPAYIPPSLGGQDGKAPPPRLNVVIQIVGSRGDVQPFVALGKVLKDTYGHRVRVATHPTFQGFIEENGLEFFSIGGDPAELMAFMVKHPGLMPGFDALKSGEVSKRRKGIAEMLVGCWRSCVEVGNGLGPAPKPHARNAPFNPTDGLPGDTQNTPFVADAIIANPPSFGHIHIAEKLGIPLHMMFTMPWSPTRAFPHPLANIQSSNADDVMTNYLSYTLVEMMTWQGLGDVINRFRENVLDIQRLSLIAAPGILTRLRIPYTYCWSPALIPKPNDWGNSIDISGFYFLNLASSFTPDPDLAAFLDDGPPPVYIGFGSIVVDDPNAMTRMIFDAVRSAGIRALVSKGWGGLGADDIGVPDGVFMLGNVPHDWLFQKVSAVVHHGGAGTTAAGIKSGKPTLVVPFFGDQPFWGAMIARANAGPDPIPYKNLTAEKLATAIKFCLQPDTQERAKELGNRIGQERGTDEGGQSFHKHLDVENMRCSLAPSRNAVWRVRRTQMKLSAIAAAALAEKDLIQYSDLKLYRSQEYITEDQPPDPISAGASSLIMDISGIGMAAADMPRSLFKSAKSCSSTAVDRAKEKREASRSASRANSFRTLSGNNSKGHSESNLSLVSSPESFQSSVPRASEESDLGDSKASTIRDSGSIDRETPTGTMTPDSTAPTTGSAQGEGPRSPSPTRARASGPSAPDPTACLEVGRGVSHIVGMGVRTPMNFCLGLAKGFRNVPRLYNDDTVRPMEKVTDFRTGLKVAGKEFGYGLFDGISGLITQPLHGAEKEGAAGLVKGFGKGIAGIVTKPAAGAWGIPAYTMQGLNAEVNKLFGRSLQNYITSSRIAQGQNDLATATAEEKADIVKRWHSHDDSDLKPFYTMKKKEHSAGKHAAGSESPSHTGGNSTPRGSFWQTRHMSFDERKKLHAEKAAAKKAQGQHQTPPAVDSDSTSLSSLSSEEAEFERAIRESVKETSRGNAEEDAMVEAAIRSSVRNMRETGQGLPEPEPIQVPAEKDPNIFKDAEYQITDEEYQALVEQAIERSLGGQPEQAAPAPDDDADDEYQRAIEASREDAKKQDSQRTEEDIVMEYVKKQSLAEEEFRLKRAASGSGTPQAGDDGQGDDDGELRRAMEASLKMSHGGGGGPSGV